MGTRAGVGPGLHHTIDHGLTRGEKQVPAQPSLGGRGVGPKRTRARAVGKRPMVGVVDPWSLSDDQVLGDNPCTRVGDQDVAEAPPREGWAPVSLREVFAEYIRSSRLRGSRLAAEIAGANAVLAYADDADWRSLFSVGGSSALKLRIQREAGVTKASFVGGVVRRAWAWSKLSPPASTGSRGSERTRAKRVSGLTPLLEAALVDAVAARAAASVSDLVHEYLMTGHPNPIGARSYWAYVMEYVSSQVGVIALQRYLGCQPAELQRPLPERGLRPSLERAFVALKAQQLGLTSLEQDAVLEALQTGDA